MLLDPVINDADVSPWQHTRIIKALLYQAENKLALEYVSIRYGQVISPEEIKLKLTVYLANG